MNLLLLLLFTVIFRMGFDIFVSQAGGKIDDWLANGIFSGIAGALPLLIFFATKSKHSLPTTKNGLIFSVIAGLSVMAFSVLLIKIYAQGGNLSYVTPVVYGGTLVGSSLVGWLVLKEPFSLLGLAGVLVITAGIGMVVLAKT
jgi:bacterial/archaeal transporter family protein